MPQPGSSLTERVQKIMALAQTAARQRGSTEPTLLDIAITLLRDDGVGASAVRAHGLDPSAIATELSSTPPGDASWQAAFSQSGMLTNAATEARELSHSYLGTEHLLLAMARDPSHPLARVLAARGFSYGDALGRIKWMLNGDPFDPPPYVPPGADA